MDLHLGAATVKPFSKKSVNDILKPKPGIIALDVLVCILAMTNLVLFYNVWKWILT